MSATALKERLRTDLKAAMQVRNGDEVRVLRTLIAALDNAEATPGEARYVLRAFGDSGSEVPRLRLDDEAVDRLLASEIDARLTAATDYERHARVEEARRLREEAALVRRYRSA